LRLEVNTLDASSQVPPPPQRPTPLRALGWLGLFALLTIVAQFGYMYGLDRFYALDSLPTEQKAERMKELVTSSFGLGTFYLLQVAVLLPPLLYAANFPEQRWTRTLALNPVPWATLGKWLLLGLVTMTVVSLVLSQFEVDEEPFMQQFLKDPHWLMLLAASVLAPVLEELLFRGYLFRAWRHSRLGLSGTLLLTSTLFAWMHALQYSWYGVAQIFCLALLLGLARERTGSVLTPIAIHATQNTLASLFMLLQ
jgi:membrane protease YdiL (CAAX protease family)